MHTYIFSVQFQADGSIVPFRVALAADDEVTARRMAWSAIKAEQRRLLASGARYVDLASFRTLSVDGKSV